MLVATVQLSGQNPAGVPKAQVSTVAAVKRGGTWSEYERALLASGFVELLADGSMLPTPAGRVQAGDVRPLSIDGVLEFWRAQIKAGARRMLDCLLQAGAAGMTGPELAEAAEVQRGGTFSEYQRSLLGAGVVEKDGDRLRIVGWLR